MTIFCQKLTALLISFLILGNAFFIKKVFGSWLLPASIYAIFWFAFTFFPLIFLFSVPITILPLAYILLSVIFFSVSSISFNWKYALQIKKLNTFDVNLSQNTFFLSHIVYVLAILATVFTIINFCIQNISISKMFFNPIQSASLYAKLRYSGELKANLFMWFSVVFSYVITSIAGLICSSSNKLLTIVSFLPSILIMLVQSSKGTFFLSLSLFCGGIFVRACLKIFSKFLRLHKIKYNLKKIILIILFITFISFLSFLSRGLHINKFDSTFFTEVKSIFLSYTSGHIYAFADWFCFYVNQTSSLSYSAEKLTKGFYTFMDFFQFMGCEKEEKLGVYTEFFFYKKLFSTNLYTIYRGLITDFGIVGSLIFTYITGYFFHLNFYYFLIKPKPIINLVLVVFMIGYFYHSFMISVLNSISFYAASMMVYAFLQINKTLYD